MKSSDMKCTTHYNILWRFEGTYIINENGHYLYTGRTLLAVPLYWLSERDSLARLERCTWMYENSHIVSLVDKQVVTTECSDRGSNRDCALKIYISPEKTSNDEVDQQYVLDYQGRPKQ